MTKAIYFFNRTLFSMLTIKNPSSSMCKKTITYEPIGQYKDYSLSSHWLRIKRSVIHHSQAFNSNCWQCKSQFFLTALSIAAHHLLQRVCAICIFSKDVNLHKRKKCTFMRKILECENEKTNDENHVCCKAFGVIVKIKVR